MKRLIYILLLSMVFTACGSSALTEKDIPGIWTVTEYTAEMPEVSPMLTGLAEEMGKTYEYNFREDHTYTVYCGFDKSTSTGTWEYDAEQKRMILTTKPTDMYDMELPEEKNTVHTITRSSRKKISWEIHHPGMGTEKFTLRKK